VRSVLAARGHAPNGTYFFPDGYIAKINTTLLSLRNFLQLILLDLSAAFQVRCQHVTAALISLLPSRSSRSRS